MATEQASARARIISTHEATRNERRQCEDEPRRIARQPEEHGETMATQATAHDDRVHDDDLLAEIDFAMDTRGRFFKPGAQLKLPVMSSSSPTASGASCTTRGRPLPRVLSPGPTWRSSSTAGAAEAGGSHDRSNAVKSPAEAGLCVAEVDQT